MFKFDKEQYRARRDRGIRGQEDKSRVLPKLAVWTEEDFLAKKCGKEAIGSERTSAVSMHMGKKGMFAVTRRMKRIKDRARGYRDYHIKVGKNTKLNELEIPDANGIVLREDTKGTLLTRPFARHIQNDEKNPKPKLPLYDPKLSNHDRHIARREERKRLNGVNATA